MKIYLKQYLVPFIGNCKSDSIELPSNKILVSELKIILCNKYSIPSSEQRLSTKISKTIVTLTNDYPLSFFYIRNNSTIYLERIIFVNKTEIIKNKLIANQSKNTKLRYLTSLGLFNTNKEQNPYMQSNFNCNLETITESPTEEITEETISNQSPEFVSTLLKNYIKENKFVLFQNWVEQHNISKDYFNRVNSSGWNTLHYAAFYGRDSFMQYLIYTVKVDLNVLNKDGWTALHLCTFKENSDWVRMWMANEAIQTDILIEKGIGTPLHIACKKNNMKIVSLLLYKANPLLKNDQGKLPIDWTTNQSVKKTWTKVMDNYPFKMNSGMNMITNNYDDDNDNENNNLDQDQNGLSRVTMNTWTEYPFLHELQFIPPKPPKALGYIEKTGRLLPIFRQRYMELDPFEGVIKRYKTIQDYPTTPNEVIQWIEINDCSKKYPIYNGGTDFDFEITFVTKEKYRVHSIVALDKWVNVINSAVIYSKFWNKWSPRYPQIKDYLLNQKAEKIFIDYETGEVKQFQDANNKNKKPNQNKKRTPVSSAPKRINELSKATIKILDDAALWEDSSWVKGIGFKSFEILDLLGSGTFGKVYKVKRLFSNQIFAMKILNKKFLIQNQQLRYAITECNVMKQSDNPFIIKLHYSFQTPEYLYMVWDYCPGGDLGYHLECNWFEEDEAKFYIAELVLAIEYWHKWNVIYRDLKPENILIFSDGHIKLADFGLAKENMNDNTMTNSFCGSPAYLAPEMVGKNGVGKSADIYGIGAVWYEMISGAPPFYANDINSWYNNIVSNQLMLHDYFSNEWKDLLLKWLCKNPTKRLGVTDKTKIKNHPWFKGVDWKNIELKKIEPMLDWVGNKLDRDNYLMKQNKKCENEKENKNEFNDFDYTDNNKNLRRVNNFTFIQREED